jgi:hypothetical protein
VVSVKTSESASVAWRRVAIGIGWARRHHDPGVTAQDLMIDGGQYPGTF